MTFSSPPPARARRLRVPRPRTDGLFTGSRPAVVDLLLLPLVFLALLAAQTLQAVAYLGAGLFFLVTSPFWTARALWRAFRPVTTPQQRDRRVAARSALGSWLIVVAVLAACAAAGWGVWRLAAATQP